MESDKSKFFSEYSDVSISLDGCYAGVYLFIGKLDGGDTLFLDVVGSHQKGAVLCRKSYRVHDFIDGACSGCVMSKDGDEYDSFASDRNACIRCDKQDERNSTNV